MIKRYFPNFDEIWSEIYIEGIREHKYFISSHGIVYDVEDNRCPYPSMCIFDSGIILCLQTINNDTRIVFLKDLLINAFYLDENKIEDKNFLDYIHKNIRKIIFNKRSTTIPKGSTLK